MLPIKDWKFIYWFVIFSLLFVPIFNSFCKNLQSLIKCNLTNKEYKTILDKLKSDNKRLSSKVRYYKTQEGLKSVIKERLNKVEDGEVLIKLDGKN